LNTIRKQVRAAAIVAWLGTQPPAGRTIDEVAAGLNLNRRATIRAVLTACRAGLLALDEDVVTVTDRGRQALES
jgi:hypothetical protein